MDGVGGGWAQAPTETLLATRRDLLGGLRLVWDHMQAGDVHEIHEGHSSSPADAGFITLALLEGCEAELTERGEL